MPTHFTAGMQSIGPETRSRPAFARDPRFRTLAVSAANARDILAAMSIDPYYEGRTYDIEEIEKECETFLRIAGAEADGAKPIQVTAGQTFGNRPKGYLRTRITALHALARRARAAGNTHIALISE